MNNIGEKKRLQRNLFSEKRKKIMNENAKAPLLLSKQIVKLKNYKIYKNIASYIPIRSEISTTYLNDFLIKNNKKVCLPIITEENRSLKFRYYSNSSKLKIGKFGIKIPNDSNSDVLPDVILTPCLAFDDYGFRMGYGGGYYDRTFAEFKRIGHRFISIVVAFEEQKVDKITTDKFDQRIDYILTEKKLYKRL